jgi:hypothetical protein
MGVGRRRAHQRQQRPSRKESDLGNQATRLRLWPEPGLITLREFLLALWIPIMTLAFRRHWPEERSRPGRATRTPPSAIDCEKRVPSATTVRRFVAQSTSRSACALAASPTS